MVELKAPSSSQVVADRQAEFIKLLPTLQRHIRFHLRGLAPAERDEKLAEGVAAAWKAFLRLKDRAADAASLIPMLAVAAVRHVRNGLHVGGSQDGANDVMSRNAQRRHGFGVAGFGTVHDLPREFHDSLCCNRKTTVADQACFKIDLAAWLRRLGPMRRKVVRKLVTGHRPSEVASKVGLSRGRISQLRGELADDWHRFQGELAVA